MGATYEIIFGIAVVSLLSVNLVWSWLTRRSVTWRIWASDPDRYGSIITSMTLTGTIVGGAMFLAVGQVGYEAGVLGYVIGAVYLIGLALSGVFAYRLRELMTKGGHDSLLGLLSATYDNRVVVQFCLLNLLVYLFLLAGQFLAIYIVAAYLEPRFSLGWLPLLLQVLAIAAMLTYPYIGGLRRDIRSDVIQVSVILIAGSILIWKLITEGGLRHLFSRLPPELLTGTAYGDLFLVGIIVFLTPSFFVRYDIWQRVRAAESNFSARWGLIGAGLLSFFFYILFTTLGMWARADGFPSPGSANLDIIFAKFLSEPILLVIVLAAFFSAVLSSADTFLNVISVQISRIFHSNLWSDSGAAASNRLLRLSRYYALGAFGGAAAISLAAPDFVDLMVGAFSIIICFFPLLLGVFVDRWRDSVAAYWSVNLALVVFMALFFGWNPKYALPPAVLLAFASYFSIMWFARRKRGP